MTTPAHRSAGRIIRLVPDKGFGFLADAQGLEYFFHKSAYTGDFDELQEHDAVTFEPHTTAPKGPRAEHVELVDL